MKITAQNYRQSVTPAVLARMPREAKDADSLFREDWSLTSDPEVGSIFRYLLKEANDAATPPRKRVNYRPAGGPIKPTFRSGVRELPKPKPAPAEASAKPAQKSSSPKKATPVKSKPKTVKSVVKKAAKKVGKALGLKPVAKKATAKKRTVKKPTLSAVKRGLAGGRKPDVRKITSSKVRANNKKFGGIQNGVLNEFYQAGKRNAPKPAVKPTYKKVARQLGLGR